MKRPIFYFEKLTAWDKWSSRIYMLLVTGLLSGCIIYPRIGYRYTLPKATFRLIDQTGKPVPNMIISWPGELVLADTTNALGVADLPHKRRFRIGVGLIIFAPVCSIPEPLEAEIRTVPAAFSYELKQKIDVKGWRTLTFFGPIHAIPDTVVVTVTLPER